jgi:predicted outer membrane repeat protein
MKPWIPLLLSLALGSGVAGATTYVVRPDGTGDFPTIQAAIEAAAHGDIIELTNGTFTGEGNRDLEFLGKAITIRSQNGNPETCVIDCEGSEAEPHRAFNLHHEEGADTQIVGLTITNGYAAGGDYAFHGGGMRCRAVSPMVIDCIFRNNQASGPGGAVYCESGAMPSFVGCVISHSRSHQGGGGLYCIWSSRVSLENCVVHNNHGAAMGGGAVFAGESPPVINGCTFALNVAEEGSGIWCHDHSWATIDNTVITFGIGGQAISYGPMSYPEVACCNIYGNEGGDWTDGLAAELGVNGNISEDPLFCDPENGDFTLHEDSPCAPFTPPNEECDLIGAWPVGCGPTAVRMGTWGAIKAMYRR